MKKDVDLDDLDNLENLGELNEDDLFELLDQINYEEHRIDDEDDINIDINNYCESCDTSDYIVEDGEKGIIVCSNCGSVLSSIMDKNPEWRQYGGDDSKGNNSRCSYPTNHFLPQSSLGTSIGGIGRSKIKTLHGWSAMPYRERSLHIVLKEIQLRCRKANILKCIEDDAKILYKNISECKHPKGTKNAGKYIIIRGTNRKSLIAACVFFACKKKGDTRSPKEIAKVFELKYTDITKGCKTFLKLMKIKQMSYDYNSSTPEHFVTRFCRALNIGKEYVDVALKIAINVQRLNVASKHTPLSVATGSILLMADIHNLSITKKTIGSKFAVSEVTITKAFRKLQLYKDIVLNDELTDKLVERLEKEKQKLIIPDNLAQRYKNITGNDINDYNNNNNNNNNKNNNDNDNDNDNVNVNDNDNNDKSEENSSDTFNDSLDLNYSFSIEEDDIDDYFYMINTDLYDQFSNTDDEYNNFISELIK